MADGPIESVVIHAVYLINCASKDREIRTKSPDSLVHALRMGDAIGADGVVLHPGSAKGEPHEEALPRVGEMLEARARRVGRCPLLLENTAGAGDTLGRSFEELAELIELCGRRQAARPLPGLLPPARLRLRHPHRRRAQRGDRRLRRDRRHRPAALPARERLADAARLEPRPPRPARRRRARPARLRRLPVGAALRGPAGALRGPGRRGQGAGARRTSSG